MGQLRKVIRLVGSPWNQMETCERITMKMIAVLASSGYTLSMPINIDKDTRVYFFIRFKNKFRIQRIQRYLTRLEIL